MNIAEKFTKYLVIAVFIGGVGVIIWQNSRPKQPANAMTVAVKVPKLSPFAIEGKVVFDKYCAACHGANASGTDRGPPFVNEIYNPGHHSDEAFFMAAKYGVRQHHWPYGDMPPRPEVSEKDVAAIVQYVRELQKANGIKYKRHVM